MVSSGFRARLLGFPQRGSGFQGVFLISVPFRVPLEVYEGFSIVGVPLRVKKGFYKDL